MRRSRSYTMGQQNPQAAPSATPLVSRLYPVERAVVPLDAQGLPRRRWMLQTQPAAMRVSLVPFDYSKCGPGQVKVTVQSQRAGGGRGRPKSHAESRSSRAGKSRGGLRSRAASRQRRQQRQAARLSGGGSSVGGVGGGHGGAHGHHHTSAYQYGGIGAAAVHGGAASGPPSSALGAGSAYGGGGGGGGGGGDTGPYNDPEGNKGVDQGSYQGPTSEI